MSRYLGPLLVIIIGLLVAAGLFFAYQAGRLDGGTASFLAILAATLGVVAVVFVKRLSHPSESVEQMLYKSDHPTQT